MIDMKLVYNVCRIGILMGHHHGTDKDMICGIGANDDTLGTTPGIYHRELLFRISRPHSEVPSGPSDFATTKIP